MFFPPAGKLLATSCAAVTITGIMTSALSFSVHSLTPIVTGDHDRRNTELLATGLLGSLRYQHWLLKAMQAWETDNQNPLYPFYSAELAPDATIPDKTERLKKRLEKVGPVVALFGGTGWKRMFRLAIENPASRDKQPASARSGQQAAYQWDFTLRFTPDRESPAFEQQFHTTVEKELRSLMSFVHHYGWLGAAPQNGFGWVEVKENKKTMAKENLPKNNPVFAAKDVVLTESQYQTLTNVLIQMYEQKFQNAAQRVKQLEQDMGSSASHNHKKNELKREKIKKQRYGNSLDHINSNGSPPIGYEIRRWLYDDQGGGAAPKSFFGRGGNNGYAGYIHVSHPTRKEQDNGWLLRLRFACRLDKQNGQVVPVPAGALPDASLQNYEQILHQQARP